ncbi:MAG: membrane dipeptidase [Pseudomonadota bacterium]
MKPVPESELPRGLPGVIARIAERVSNQTDSRDLPFNDAAEGMFLADLHCDTLLWGIDPLESRLGGHVDGPRTKAARIGLQVFAAPTWTPLPFRNDEDRLVVSRNGFDQSHALFPTELFSPARRRNAKRRRRALAIARRFRQMVAQSAKSGAPLKLTAIMSVSDLKSAGQGDLSALLALEGLHWLDDDADAATVEAAVQELFDAGYRMMAPTHRFSNGLGGASENSDGRGGLTMAGRRFVAACLDRWIVLDLAHASPALIREACGMALTHESGPRPVIVSHAGVKRVNPHARNLSDGDIRAVVSTGGLIGVGFWRSAMGWTDDETFQAKMGRIVESFAATLAVLSEQEFADEMIGRYGRYDPFEHLAFGSDFDGATTTAFDVTGVSHVVAALKACRNRDLEPVFPAGKLPLIAGENVRRVLAAALPQNG